MLHYPCFKFFSSCSSWEILFISLSVWRFSWVAWLYALQHQMDTWLSWPLWSHQNLLTARVEPIPDNCHTADYCPRFSLYICTSRNFHPHSGLRLHGTCDTIFCCLHLKWLQVELPPWAQKNMEHNIYLCNTEWIHILRNGWQPALTDSRCPLL